MNRNVVDNDQDARTDLGQDRSKPAWRQTRRALPFQEMSADEFEVLCFLLLRKEHPADSVYYFGKTADAGRDVVHTQSNGRRRLVQCKRFAVNVSKDKITQEMAKLFVNVFTGVIPEKPDEVDFYVASDLTSPALRLLEKQSEWIAIANKALRTHLKCQCSPDLLSFAKSWWPEWRVANAVELTDRCGKFPDLIEEFFGVRKVIDASRQEIRRDRKEDLVPIIAGIEQLKVLLAQGVSSNTDEAIAAMLARILGISADRNAPTRQAVPGYEGVEPTSDLSRLVQAQIAAKLAKALGAPVSAALQVTRPIGPPPLPDNHVSRPNVVVSLTEQLRTHPVVAVTGYAECGKSTALSEFARQLDCECLWFTASTDTSENASLLLYSIAGFLGINSLSVGEIGAALHDRIAKAPVLIVIDDAHLFGDLQPVDFLLKVAAAWPHRLRIVFAATDTPAFTTEMSAAGIRVHRLPGMLAEQALAMYQLLGIDITLTRKAAVELLCAQSDGHVGLLRLSADLIRRASDPDELRAMILSLPHSTGTSADQFHAAIIEQFRASLPPKTLELCRRLAITVSPFKRELAYALWEAEQPAAEFPAAWNQSVAGVFEPKGTARYSIPYLYQSGLVEYSTSEERTRWHTIASDSLAALTGDFIDPLDVSDSVIHRFRAGERIKGLDQACSILAIAAQSKRPDITAFLLARFDLLLDRVAEDPSVPRSTRIRWYLLHTHLGSESGQPELAESAANKLLALLDTTPSEPDETWSGLAWAVLLMHAARAGRPQLAVRAIKAAPVKYLSDLPGEAHGGHVVLLLTSVLNARENPLPLIEGLITQPAAYNADTSHLWNQQHGFGIWRAIEGAIYSAVDREWGADKTRAQEQIAQLKRLCDEAQARGLREIATVLGATLVHLLIDFSRDFDAARQVARRFVALAETTETRVRAHAHHVLGDALRCGGHYTDAVGAYKTAMESWPSDEVFGRGLSTLMLGISSAQNGDYALGYRQSVQAASIYGRQSQFASASAQALLEASAMALHLKNDRQALRRLIQAHAALKGKRTDRPEWIGLAQCAMAIAPKPASQFETQLIASPGFTIGLHHQITDRERMLAVAPTLVLARACSALGRPYRALSYFSSVLDEVSDPQLASHISYLAIDAAIDTRQLDSAAKFVVLANLMPRPSEDLAGRISFDTFLDDYITERVVGLAIELSSNPDGLSQLESARAAVAHQNSDSHRLLLSALSGMITALKDGNASDLDNAYLYALGRSALRLARDLAWFWCYRFHPGRPCSVEEAVHWHWRLALLSLAIGRRDTPFMSGFADQERTVWNRVTSKDSESLVTEVCTLLGDPALTAEVRVERLVSCLGKHCCLFLGVKALFEELTITIAGLNNRSVLAPIQPYAAIRVLDVALTPGADAVYAEVAEVVDQFAANSAAIADSDPEVERWMGLARRLRSIVGVLEVGQGTAEAFEALLAFSEYSNFLSPTAETNWYVWLRHLLTCTSCEPKVIERVMEFLRQPRVQILIGDTSVPAHLRHRLGICNATAIGQLGISQLTAAMKTASLQGRPGLPVTAGALAKNRSAIAAAFQTIKEANAAFDATERELRREGSTGIELWQCCQERAGLHRVVGTLLAMQSNEDGKERDARLRNALDGYATATAVAQTTKNSECVLRSAHAALLLAEFLNLDEERRQFAQIVELVRGEVSDQNVIASLEEERANDPLVSVRSRAAGESGVPTDDDGIKKYADAILEATGLPEDRRRAIEDDIQKQGRILQVQREYCKFLQPLQNLEHMLSPDTAYLFKPKYTCACTLLGYKTAIEQVDIEVVINAMQRTYCDGCSRREPGGNAS